MQTSITSEIFPLSEKFRFSLVYRPAFLGFDWSILVLRVVAGRILLYEEMSRCIALHCIASHCSFLRYLVCLVFPRQTNSSDDQSWSDKFQLVLQVARKVQVIVGSIKRKIKSLRCSKRFHFVILRSSC